MIKKENKGIQDLSLVAQGLNQTMGKRTYSSGPKFGGSRLELSSGKKI